VGLLGLPGGEHCARGVVGAAEEDGLGLGGDVLPEGVRVRVEASILREGREDGLNPQLLQRPKVPHEGRLEHQDLVPLLQEGGHRNRKGGPAPRRGDDLLQLVCRPEPLVVVHHRLQEVVLGNVLPDVGVVSPPAPLPEGLHRGLHHVPRGLDVRVPRAEVDLLLHIYT